MRKKRNINVGWQTNDAPNFTWEQVQIEVLMDIRDELQRLNSLLHCPNFMAIPSKLDAIRRKIPARKRAKK